MRHASLQMNVVILYTKYDVWTLNIKQDIYVKKIKGKKILFNLSKNIFK